MLWELWLSVRVEGTTEAVQVLMTPDVFEAMDWPGIFSERSTPLKEALYATFRDPEYSGVMVEF